MKARIFRNRNTFQCNGSLFNGLFKSCGSVGFRSLLLSTLSRALVALSLYPTEKFRYIRNYITKHFDLIVERLKLEFLVDFGAFQV